MPAANVKIYRSAALVCFILTFLVLPGASTQAYGNTLLDRKITLRLTDTALGEVLDAIAAQAGCSFSYSNTLLGSNRKVSVNYHKKPLRDVLTDLLKDELGSIQVQGNTVLLIAAATQVSGTIRTTAGVPLPYIAVHIDGTRYGTITADDGTFKLKIPAPGQCILVATALGYQPEKQSVQVAPGQKLSIDFSMKETSVQINEVLVTAERTLASTATRTQTPVRDLPMPVLVIQGRQLEMMGSRRLHEVLQEQTGLALTTDPSGASNALGLQVQGFDASYTMIMIDGQPLIGRNSVGILDLSRITIANIERIEIIKGTSSALYGSDALAGVVNIITRKQHTAAMLGTATVRYGTNNTFDATADGSTPFLNKRATAAISTNYYRTDGFDADPSTPGKTLPPFYSYALQGKAGYRLTPASLLNGSLRYASRNQRNRYDLDQIGKREDTNIEQDLSATALLQQKAGAKTDIQTQYYFTQYTARTTATDVNTQERINENKFRQYFHRFESFANYTASPALTITAGLGGNAEMLNASRYGSRRTMQNGFAYIQTHYTPAEKLGILAGLRYDVHNIYGRQLSPRLGVRYTVTDWLILKGTAGTGFKAPSFQQLYLAFTNPSAGYTVLGAAVFEDEVARMQQAGEIKDLYPIAAQVGDLKAEHSTSFNAGFMLTPARPVTLEVNAFRNTIRNMIFEELVGMKQNGSQLYSYRNIERAFTQGIETNLRWTILEGIELSAGHQLLFAKDQGVIDEIRAGKKQVRTPEGRSRTAVTADYFNLTNRSRHMANIKIFAEHKRLGTSLSLRANYRGRYGMGDRNYPNNFIDPYDLYVKEYVLFNATLEKKLLANRLSLQLICDNLANYSNSLIPNLQPRQLMLSASWKMEKKINE